MCSSSVPDFLARKYTVNGIYRTENPQSREEYRRAENSTVQYSRADQSREEKSRYYSREQQSRTKLRIEND